MIVSPESQYKRPAQEQSEEQEQQTPPQQPESRNSESGSSQPQEPPPSYTSAAPAPVPLPPALTVRPPQAPTKPANYLSLVRNDGCIKGTYTIDPHLSIPTSFLPPLCPGEAEADRTNLRLESRNGGVDADIWLVGGERRDPSQENVLKKDPPRKRTMIVLSTWNGSITAKIRTSTNPDLITTPFHLEATSYNGSVTILIPRSFRGLLTLTTRNGSTHISESLSQHTTTFSEVHSMRKCFVGDFTDDFGEDRWYGDEVSIEAKNGSVKIKYVDEGRSKKADNYGGGCFGRMLWCR